MKQNMQLKAKLLVVKNTIEEMAKSKAKNTKTKYEKKNQLLEDRILELETQNKDLITLLKNKQK